MTFTRTCITPAYLSDPNTPLGQKLRKSAPRLVLAVFVRKRLIGSDGKASVNPFIVMTGKEVIGLDGKPYTLVTLPSKNLADKGYSLDPAHEYNANTNDLLLARSARNLMFETTGIDFKELAPSLTSRTLCVNNPTQTTILYRDTMGRLSKNQETIFCYFNLGQISEIPSLQPDTFPSYLDEMNRQKWEGIRTNTKFVDLRKAMKRVVELDPAKKAALEPYGVHAGIRNLVFPQNTVDKVMPISNEVLFYLETLIHAKTAFNTSNIQTSAPPSGRARWVEEAELIGHDIMANKVNMNKLRAKCGLMGAGRIGILPKENFKL